MSASAATSEHETAMFFDAGGHALFGIHTAPTVRSTGVVAILLPVGGMVSVDRNRFAVRLARSLAGHGFHALRFDYHGVGESEGPASPFRLDRPFSVDLEGAVDWARRVGLDRVVLVGSCFGARTALDCVPRLDGLEAVVLLAMPVRDYELGGRVASGLTTPSSRIRYARKVMNPRVVAGILDPRKRRAYARAARTILQGRAVSAADAGASAGASGVFLDSFERLVQRATPTLIVHGTDDDLWQDFRRATRGRLGELLRDSSTTEVVSLDGPVHGLRTLDVQDAVLERVGGWLVRMFAASAARRAV